MPFVVLLIGLVLVLLEFFSSGGLFAIIGGAAIVASVIWAGFMTSAVLPTLAFAAVAACATYGVVRFGMRQVRTRMRLSQDQGGSRAAPIDEKLIGSRGVASTDLKPSGNVEIKGVPYPALSQKGYIKRGEKIEVIRVQMGHLIVR